jgi:hypothetical protein
MQASKNTKGFWGEIRTSGLLEYGLWPARVANPELDPGSRDGTTDDTCCGNHCRASLMATQA